MAGKIAKKISKVSKENTVGVIAAVIVLLIVLLVVAITFKISSDRRQRNLGGGTSISDIDEEADKLINSAEESSVKIYIERGVIADEKHYSIEMTVSATSRTIRVLHGYNNVEERSEGLPNNLEAYIAFLKALEKYKFTTVREDKSGFGWREACPTEKSYRFSMNIGSLQEFERSYTFCDGDRYGDYGGRVTLVHTLFKNQFPKYSEYVRGVRI